MTDTSPRPWSLFIHEEEGGDGEISICAEEEWIAKMNLRRSTAKADAALIVKAVNEREALFADMKIKETEMRLSVDSVEKDRAEACLMRDRAKAWNSVWLKENEKLRDKLYASEAERDRLRDIVRRLARVVDDTLQLAEAMRCIVPDNPERAKARNEIEALLCEARAAITDEVSDDSHNA